MLETLRRLLGHLRWADQRALAALRGAKPLPAQALGIYAHILGAESVWLERIRAQQAPQAGQAHQGLPVWPRLSLEQCGPHAEDLHAAFARLLRDLGEADLGREIAYVNSAGQAFTNRLDDILLHVFLHGTYHRGQVALLVRQGGSEPVPTDYIAFVRGVPAATRTSGAGKT
jgi:uncharacterized damage-inducible protein DinB